MISIIKQLNNILTKGTLILHIEPSNTLVKAVTRIDYTLYIHSNTMDRPYKIWSTAKSIKAGDSIDSLDEEITEELLKFVMKGGVKQYE